MAINLDPRKPERRTATLRVALLVGATLATSVGAEALVGTAQAQDGVVVCKAALAEPASAAACAAAGVILRELFVADRPFGPNGELMRILVSPVTIVDGNIRGAAWESGELAKVLRGALGISIRDIERYGLFGGSSSVFRKPFG